MRRWRQVLPDGAGVLPRDGKNPRSVSWTQSIARPKASVARPGRAPAPGKARSSGAPSSPPRWSSRTRSWRQLAGLGMATPRPARHFAHTQLPAGRLGPAPGIVRLPLRDHPGLCRRPPAGRTTVEAAWLIRARAWLAAAGGDVYGLPSWGKFWLSSARAIYGRAGLNPCPPELFLLPAWLPFAPDRLYCHTRSIYLGMATVWPQHPTRDPGPLGAALRDELGLDGRNPSPAPPRSGSPPTPSSAPAERLRLLYDAVRLDRPRHPRTGRGAPRYVGARWTTASPAWPPRHAPAATRACPRSAAFLAALALAPGRPAGGAPQAWPACSAGPGCRRAGRPPPRRRPLHHMGHRLRGRRRCWPGNAAANGGAATPSPCPAARACRNARGCPPTLQAGPPVASGAAGASATATHRWPVSDCTAEALTAVLLCEAKPGLIPPGERIAAAATAPPPCASCSTGRTPMAASARTNAAAPGRCWNG